MCGVRRNAAHLRMNREWTGMDANVCKALPVADNFDHVPQKVR